MLVLDGSTGAVADRTVRDLPGCLSDGDLLVFNDTRVLPARLLGNKPSGGRVEVLLERALAGTQALVQLSASKPIRPGLEVSTDGGTLRVLERDADLWRVSLPAPALEFFARWGSVPLPPYIHRSADSTDRERYQSIFARAPGAVAAPTASLHFDAPLAGALAARGVERTFVTLHVGAGTFQPVRTDDLAAHTMHAEWTSVGAEACAAIARTHARRRTRRSRGDHRSACPRSRGTRGGRTRSRALERGDPAVHHPRVSSFKSPTCCSLTSICPSRRC